MQEKEEWVQMEHSTSGGDGIKGGGGGGPGLANNGESNNVGAGGQGIAYFYFKVN